MESVTSALVWVFVNYMTELWQPIIKKICELSNKKYNSDTEKAMRIIADHIRAVVMISADRANILPSNKDQAYVLRMLIRRMLRYAKILDIDIISNFDIQIAKLISDMFFQYYPVVKDNFNQVENALLSEKNKFAKTIERGLKETVRYLENIVPGEKLSGE